MNDLRSSARNASQPAEAPWRDRLRHVIRAVFGNNVLAAAKVAGIDSSNLARLLDPDRVANPRLDTLRKLAEAYVVPLGWLLGEVHQLPAEKEKGHSPTWIVLVDQYYDTQRDRLLETLTVEDRRDSLILRIEEFESAADAAVLELLARAEVLDPQATEFPDEMDFHRRTREVRTEMVRRAVEQLTRTRIAIPPQ